MGNLNLKSPLIDRDKANQERGRITKTANDRGRGHGLGGNGGIHLKRKPVSYHGEEKDRDLKGLRDKDKQRDSTSK